MRNEIDQVIGKLERIQVAGVGAILMGEALKELLAIRDNMPGPEEEKEDADD